MFLEECQVTPTRDPLWDSLCPDFVSEGMFNIETLGVETGFLGKLIFFFFFFFFFYMSDEDFLVMLVAAVCFWLDSSW